MAREPRSTVELVKRAKGYSTWDWGVESAAASCWMARFIMVSLAPPERSGICWSKRRGQSVPAAAMAIWKPSPRPIRRVTGGRAERITAAQVFSLAAQGDAVAQRVVDDVCTYLGIALANIVHFINPGIIILGGQVAQAGDLLLQPLQERVRQLCMPGVRQSVQIVQGKLGSEASITGAVTLALQDL